MEHFLYVIASSPKHIVQDSPDIRTGNRENKCRGRPINATVTSFFPCSLQLVLNMYLSAEMCDLLDLPYGEPFAYDKMPFKTGIRHNYTPSANLILHRLVLSYIVENGLNKDRQGKKSSIFRVDKKLKPLIGESRTENLWNLQHYLKSHISKVKPTTMTSPEILPTLPLVATVAVVLYKHMSNLRAHL